MDVWAYWKGEDGVDASYTYDNIWNSRGKMPRVPRPGENHTAVNRAPLAFQRVRLKITSLASLGGEIPIINQNSLHIAEQCELRPCIRTYDLMTNKGLQRGTSRVQTYGIFEGMSFAMANQPLSLPNIGPINTICWKPDEANVSYEWTEAGYSWTATWPCSAGTECEILANRSRFAFCMIENFSVPLNKLIPSSLTTMSLANGWVVPESDLGLAMPFVLAHNFSYLMEKVATSLTNLALDLSNEKVYGHVEGFESYVMVRWKWLAFPVVLELIGVVLFCAAAARSRRDEIPLWRSSTLPFFYSGLDRQTGETQSHNGTLHSMEQCAERATITLNSLYLRTRAAS